MNEAKIKQGLDYIERTNCTSYIDFMQKAIKENMYLHLRKYVGEQITYILICDKLGEKVDEEFLMELRP